MSSARRERATARSRSLPALPTAIHASVAAADPRSIAIGNSFLGVTPRSAESTSNARRSSSPAPNPSGHTGHGDTVAWAAASTRTIELRQHRRRTVGEGLHDVRWLDTIGPVEIRDRSVDLQRAVEPPPRQRVQLYGRREQVPRGRRQSNLPPGGRTGQMRVAREPECGVPAPLARSCLLDAAADRLRALADVLAQQLLSSQTRDDQSEVDAVKQRPSQLGGVGVEPVAATEALPNGIALETARTWVRGGDEREPRGKLDGPNHPGHHHAPVLHRLPQTLDRVSTKLRELVQEQDP